MATRSIRFREAQLRELLESPAGTVGQHFHQVAANVTRAAKSEANSKLQRGAGSQHYADSFRSTVERGPKGLRFRVENTRRTADGYDVAAGIEKGTRPHIIRPRKAGGVLVFQVRGETVFAREVHHPGTKAYRIMETALRRAVRRGR